MEDEVSKLSAPQQQSSSSGSSSSSAIQRRLNTEEGQIVSIVSPTKGLHEVLDPDILCPIRVGDCTWLFWIDLEGNELHPEMSLARLTESAATKNPLRAYRYQMDPLYDTLISAVAAEFWSWGDWEKKGFPAIRMESDRSMAPMDSIHLDFLTAQLHKAQYIMASYAAKAWRWLPDIPRDTNANRCLYHLVKSKSCLECLRTYSCLRRVRRQDRALFRFVCCRLRPLALICYT